MATTSAVARPAKKPKKSAKDAPKRAWWLTDTLHSDQMQAVASSETELLNAAVLCAALAATHSEPSDTDKQVNDRAARELEMHLRKSPLPHSLQLSVLRFTRDYVLIQSDLAMICAVRATKPADILQTVVGSAVPLSQPYVHRFGGARIHAPFWTRTQRLDLQEIHHQARQAKKMLLLCGHSIGGSIAQLAFCELVYQHLPTKTRLFLEKRDYDQQKQDEKKENSTTSSDGLNFGLMVQGTTEEERATILRTTPHMLAIGFGAPYIGSTGLVSFLEPLQLSKRVITFVNEFDCIPSILNVAQSAAMVAKTTERLLTITKATKTLVNLLPIQMQQRFIDLAATANTATVPTASSAYLSMSLNILQNTFQKFRDYNIVKEIDYQYSPCGTYIFLSKSGADYKVYSDPSAISKALHKEDDSNSSLTGNAILQHLMSAYVAAVARRSNSIQINASMDYYERLGVPRNATERQIRSAYKRLALKWHPDRWANNSANPQEQASAEEIFKLLAESYEILSEAEARNAYDSHLNDSPSLKDEFVHHGTVNGMTLDEAITTFRDVIDNLSGAVSKVTSRFSTPSSTVVNPLRTPSSVRSGLIPNNHDNIFAPDRIRVSRTIGIGADQQEQILYLEPEEIIAGDVAAPAQAAGRSGANAGLRTVSVVGGAVAVGASVALIVNAWSQYSEMSRKRRQAEVVRDMPADCLLLLLEDHRNTQHSDTTQLLRQQADERKKRKDASSLAVTDSSEVDESTAKQLFVRGAQQALVTMKQQEDAAEDELIEEFFDCATEYDNAAMEAMAEEEFFDCVDVMDEVSVQFSDDALAEEKRAEEEAKAQGKSIIVSEQVVFPPGSTVSTPFGLATVHDWREGRLSAIVQFASCKFMVGYIQKTDISRGASLVKAATSELVESKRAKLADRVVARYRLDAGEAGSTLKSLVAAGGDGALDSGIRAAGGVALANGMARTSSALGGAVAAPLTIASILVDIGKEYYDYRKRYTDRKSLGVLSTTTEQLMMHDFRLKTGEVIASRTAAAAGAGIGAYSVASALGMWSTAGLAAGPVGIVAATSAAVVGGMLGFFAGSKAYSASTAGYFTSQQNAKEHIDRLELGARILFDEFDPDATGTISKENCIKLMKKLYDAMGSISETGYERTMAVIQDENFEGPVTWGMFWEWVSTEAARALRELEHEESKMLSEPVVSETWWNSYMKYFSYLNSKKATPLLAEPQAVMYPSVFATLGVGVKGTGALSEGAELQADEAEEESLIMKAQVEFLVNNGHLTVGDAFQLREQLASDDLVLKESARKTIAAMHEGLSDAGPDQNLVCDGFGFTGGDTMELPADEPEKENDTTRTKTATSGATDEKTKASPETDERLDVMCSLMSTQGLQRFLQRQNVLVPTGDNAAVRHEDLHCLALMAAAPASASAAQSN
ncbi:DnaJ domain [Phytophthora infestans]|uniref:DnaJ domain n=1 Tax=Phytophthora infestans TaxID=4787 RepID=A0A8S9U6C3_PHYIN|nr:DnaJ domain [Phytophthora infestans]